MENQVTKHVKQPKIMEMILEKASKVDLIRSFNALTLEKVVKGDYPTISAIKRNEGTETAETVLQIMIADLSDSFGGALEVEDIEEIAVSISCGILKNMTLEDVYIATRDLKKSKIHGKLDLNKVLLALENHLNARTDLIAEINRNDHLSTKFIDNKRQGDPDKQSMKDAKNWYMNHLAKNNQI